MDSIKPCPFCGSLKVEVVRTNEQACWIECDFESGGCGARTSSHKTRDGAIKRWNRRDTPTQYAEVTYDMDKEFTKVGLVDVITLEDHKSALADVQATVEALQRDRIFKEYVRLFRLCEPIAKMLSELSILPIGCSREQELAWKMAVKNFRHYQRDYAADVLLQAALTPAGGGQNE